MKTSDSKVCRAFYDASADQYDAMMDAEIDTPLYRDVLQRLAQRIAGLAGELVDTSCGSGHMLRLYHQYDDSRRLCGFDVSPRMVAITAARLGKTGTAQEGDMRHLNAVRPGSAAALLNYFSLHHVNPEEVPLALAGWYSALAPGGQLLLATWEGEGPIDYGEGMEMIALCYSGDEVRQWVEQAGFRVDRCEVKPVEEMPMSAVYLEGTKI